MRTACCEYRLLSRHKVDSPPRANVAPALLRSLVPPPSDLSSAEPDRHWHPQQRSTLSCDCNQNLALRLTRLPAASQRSACVVALRQPMRAIARCAAEPEGVGQCGYKVSGSAATRRQAVRRVTSIVSVAKLSRTGGVSSSGSTRRLVGLVGLVGLCVPVWLVWVLALVGRSEGREAAADGLSVPYLCDTLLRATCSSSCCMGS